MKLWAEKFYKSKTWKDCRKSYLKSVHGICERCGGIAKIVHHKIHLTPDNINDTYTTLAAANLEAVCQDCHNCEHHGRAAEREAARGYTFTDAGQIIIAPHFAAPMCGPSTEPPG
ncbi:MAG: HNH endonuclease [Defluviitaleaceae bacterium]|nr:HNH endonuclease [Defluviitaleaceae bacterium]